MNKSLLSLVKVIGLTAVSVFLGTLSSVNTMPTTLAEWKAAVVPALWAVFLAERLLVQSAVTADLTATPPPAPPPPPAAPPAPAVASQTVQTSSPLPRVQ